MSATFNMEFGSGRDTMELKNAVAVCLISLFSAALVVLIARSLDNQAASRLEPQLERIAEELRAIRAQGGIPAAAESAETAEAFQDGLIVYYFHGKTRCPTCEAIESQAYDVVHLDFAEPLQRGEMTWKVMNYEAPESADLKEEFEIIMANVVLAKMEGGKCVDWRRLDKVWALWNDPPAFEEFIRSEIDKMLKESDASGTALEEPDLLEIPLPDMPAPPLPQSDAPVDLPLP